MNAPTPALVASRPERLRLVGQRQMLAVMHQRLMFGMLVYGGIVALIVARILWLAAFGDHAGRKQGLTELIPERDAPLSAEHRPEHDHPQRKVEQQPRLRRTSVGVEDQASIFKPCASKRSRSTSNGWRRPA